MQYLKRQIILSLILTALFYSIFIPKAYAYLDPGTGSYFIQVVIALALGGLFLIKSFWSNIRGFLKSIFSKRNKKHE